MPDLVVAATAATAAATDAPSPWLFILGGLAVVVVSILGPLSRLMEHRSRMREEQQANQPVAPPPDITPPAAD